MEATTQYDLIIQVLSAFTADAHFQCNYYCVVKESPLDLYDVAKGTSCIDIHTLCTNQAIVIVHIFTIMNLFS